MVFHGVDKPNVIIGGKEKGEKTEKEGKRGREIEDYRGSWIDTPMDADRFAIHSS